MTLPADCTIRCEPDGKVWYNGPGGYYTNNRDVVEKWLTVTRARRIMRWADVWDGEEEKEPQLEAFSTLPDLIQAIKCADVDDPKGTIADHYLICMARVDDRKYGGRWVDPYCREEHGHGGTHVGLDRTGERCGFL